LDEHYEFNDQFPQYNKEKVWDTKAADTNREIGKSGKVQVVKPEEFEFLNHATNSGKTESNEGLMVPNQ